MSRKPTSVQFKFFKDLSYLTDPTEPHMPTLEIPAQDQKKLSRPVRKWYRVDAIMLTTFALALALCGGLFLMALFH